MRKLPVYAFSMTARIALAAAVVAAPYAQTQTSVPAQHAIVRRSNLPAEMRSGLSAALGKDTSSYHAQAAGDGLDAANPRQDLAFHFNAEGVEVRSGTAHWQMAVRGYGYGEAIQNVSAAAPSANQNRVDYRRRGLTEWYVNGPIGLEQGFTISEPPSKVRTGLLTVAMALSGNLQAAVDQSGEGLSLSGRDGNAVLRYSGLSARDAEGKTLRTRLEMVGGELLLRADDTGARYPVVVDPWVQVAELTASDGQDNDMLGISVGVSGNTLVAGSVNATVKGNAGQGAAYVFVKPSSGWKNMKQTAKLTSSDGQAGDGFGGAVYIVGGTIVVGACPQSGICNGPGKVYVFLKPSAGWKTTSTFQAELTASDGTATDGFSNELALNADGNTVVVGAAGATIGGRAGQGAAYVFVKPTAGWKTATQTAKLTQSKGAPNNFAGEVSVTGSGSTVFVGAPGIAVAGNPAQGVAFIYEKPAGGWKTTSQFTAKLSAKDGAAYDDFGFCQAGSTCITGDGSTVLVGAPQLNFSTGTATGPGKAYIFVKPAGGWKTTSTFDAELTASTGQTGDAFGWSVAINSANAAIGAVAGDNAIGEAYVFAKPKTGWKTTSKYTARLRASDGRAGDAFGFSVSISGNAIAVGSINHPQGDSTGPGAAYVFGP